MVPIGVAEAGLFVPVATASGTFGQAGWPPAVARVGTDVRLVDCIVDTVADAVADAAVDAAVEVAVECSMMIHSRVPG
jgi:hypothetical protein